jgi:genome maintenance exonuclease 1|tara:strand:+ start:4348 stop:5016 length:669 start_codon:yes stop_codon:yes gene_type:complete
MFNHVKHDVVLPKLTRKSTEAGRRYFTPDGNAYPSITTVLGILSKQGILEWRKRVGEVEANRISTQAATRGTAVHKLAEDYIDNVEGWSKGAMPANIASFNDLKNILDKRLDNIWFQEEFLYSDRLKCAGQVDCIAEFDGQLSIVDFKTSRKPKKEEWITSYFIQASFYAAAFYERTGIPIKQGVILITVDGSEPQVFKVNTYDYLEHFLKVRKQYKIEKGI